MIIMALGLAGLSGVALARGSWDCRHLGVPLSWLTWLSDVTQSPCPCWVPKGALQRQVCRRATYDLGIRYHSCHSLLVKIKPQDQFQPKGTRLYKGVNTRRLLTSRPSMRLDTASSLADGIWVDFHFLISK